MNTLNNWKLYVHINKINRKRYVGITSKENPEHRWNHGRGYLESPHFYSSILKYGWDGFDHIILLDNLSHIQACEAEKMYIKMWNTNNPEYGYNMTAGGEGSPGVIVSQETRNKLSELRKRENLSAETLRRRSESLRGRKFTEDHKMKIGKGNSKAVLMMSTDGYVIQEFQSATLAERETGIQHSHISQCCNGRRKTAGGYTWSFV